MNYHRDKDYQKFESTFKNIFLKRYHLISKFVRQKGKVLDIGASTGTFLQIFKEHGWETWGVEPSRSGEDARDKGHKVLRTIFEKAELPKNYFDLVVMNHTLEHMDDPVRVLGKIHGILKKDGVLFVDVPNAGGLGAKILGKKWPYLLPKEHKNQFTRKMLLKIFKNTGFKVIRFESRSGIFEYANPFLELHRKGFLLDIITIPYSLITSALNMGDSMSLIGKKL